MNGTKTPPPPSALFNQNIINICPVLYDSENPSNKQNYPQPIKLESRREAVLNFCAWKQDTYPWKFSFFCPWKKKIHSREKILVPVREKPLLPVKNVKNACVKMILNPWKKWQKMPKMAFTHTFGFHGKKNTDLEEYRVWEQPWPRLRPRLQQRLKPRNFAF